MAKRFIIDICFSIFRIIDLGIRISNLETDLGVTNMN